MEKNLPHYTFKRMSTKPSYAECCLLKIKSFFLFVAEKHELIFPKYFYFAMVSTSFSSMLRSASSLVNNAGRNFFSDSNCS